jgi:hypothetical protein
MNLDLNCPTAAGGKKIIKKTRQKCKYKKVDNSRREKLIEMVHININKKFFLELK